MEVAFVLALIAVVLFGVEFIRSAPNWSVLALGLAFFAASVAVFFFETSPKLGG